MYTLIMLFAFICIVGLTIIIWMNTKAGKKWLDSLD